MKTAEVYQEEWCVTLQNPRQLNKNSVAGNTPKISVCPWRVRGKQSKASSESVWPQKSGLASCLQVEYINERGRLSNGLRGKELRPSEFLWEKKWPSQTYSFLWEVAARMFYHSIKVREHGFVSVFNMPEEFCTWNSFCGLVSVTCVF